MTRTQILHNLRQDANQLQINIHQNAAHTGVSTNANIRTSPVRQRLPLCVQCQHHVSEPVSGLNQVSPIVGIHGDPLELPEVDYECAVFAAKTVRYVAVLPTQIHVRRMLL